jgi:hypothetical protein
MSQRFVLDELKGKDLQEGHGTQERFRRLRWAGPYAVPSIEGGKEPAGMPVLHVSKNYAVMEEKAI